MSCYDDDDDDYTAKKEREFKIDNSRPYCVISPYTSSRSTELYNRSWFETEEQAQRYAAKCLAGKKAGCIVVVKAVSLVSVPLPQVEVISFSETE